ncbi:response regulator transcription factor [Dyella caseinilytica]|uniref:Response regulator transcription factor n=1 Tax=Dyella caseinilytica TaxID=1849581 RepID=A0ABX7GVR6_9GAMM|nr:response regulator transcription factor [Dyella caseinilytica]QRN54501.1 response regulator transcription factor [Dyella caseinilytica]GFZ94721.1 DNA-binding response regulator [Dyella caseinilytica]
MNLPQDNHDFDPRHIYGYPLRVAIADDHPLLLAGLTHELEKHPGVTIAGSAQNSTELVELLNRQPVDVVISDYAMPGGTHGDGIALFGYLKRRFPKTHLIAVTMMSNPGVIRSLVAQGVDCILSKSDSLTYVAGALYAGLSGKRFFSPSIEAIVKMHGAGNTPPDAITKNLTVRELEVVRLFVSGLTVSEIAERLHRSKQTISTQKMSAMRRLGIRRDADLIKYGIDSDLTLQANIGSNNLPRHSLQAGETP